MAEEDTSRKGFTLVEMLIVIVIIGVLAGLLLPMLLRIRRRARSAECQNNLKQLYGALELYRNEHDGFYPSLAVLPTQEMDNRPSLREVLIDYAPNPKVFRCPMDTDGYFEREGASYQYFPRLAGQRVLAGRFAQALGSTRTPVFFDYEEFHGPQGTVGSRNFVFVDGHVGTSMDLDLDGFSDEGDEE